MVKVNYSPTLEADPAIFPLVKKLSQEFDSEKFELIDNLTASWDLKGSEEPKNGKVAVLTLKNDRTETTNSFTKNALEELQISNYNFVLVLMSFFKRSFHNRMKWLQQQDFTIGD